MIVTMLVTGCSNSESLNGEWQGAPVVFIRKESL